jgi:hypothetical protein
MIFLCIEHYINIFNYFHINYIMCFYTSIYNYMLIFIRGITYHNYKFDRDNFSHLTESDWESEYDSD